MQTFYEQHGASEVELPLKSSTSGILALALDPLLAVFPPSYDHLSLR